MFINRLLQNTEFDKMRFRVKNQYYVFLYIKECHLEIYFGISDFSYNIDVKGGSMALNEYKRYYEKEASNISNWRNINKNKLVNGFIENENNDNN